MNRALGRILVIRGGAIGDFILTTPALAALRGQFPETRIEILGYPHIAQLALVGGLADEVKSIEAGALATFFAARGALDPALGDYFKQFAVIISYLYDPDLIFQTNVMKFSGGQFISGPYRPDERGALHATEVFLRPLERLAIFEADPRPRLDLASIPAQARLAEGTWIAAHPGSGSERKNWPEWRWMELLGQLSELRDLNLMLIGGEAEGDRLDKMKTIWPKERLLMARNWPLAHLGAALRSCRLFIGHDSGITHLASSVGVPGLILWGESKRDIWSPLGDKIKILFSSSGLDHLPADAVFDEAMERLGKRREH